MFSSRKKLDYGLIARINREGVMLGPARLLELNRKDLLSLEQVLAVYVKGHKVAVQAGGCLGVFAKRLAQSFNAVYCFEPDPKLFRILAQNVEAPNVVLMQAALGDGPVFVSTVQELPPGKTTWNDGMTSTRVNLGGEGIIPTLRIDDLALPDCDLIYLDVEGDELKAIKGAHYTLSMLAPVVVVEMNHNLPIEKQSQLRRALIENYDYEFKVKLRSDEVYVKRS
jgi:FkbM family methyltransferase